jgi:hypothetical protein
MPIAIESGETFEACFTRLLSYGVEVHRDLVGGGENPLGLTTPNGGAALAQAA